MKLILGAILSIAVMQSPVLAHHSFAMYDVSKEMTLTGKVTRYVSGSNYAQLMFELVGQNGQPLMENGAPVRWGVEMASASQLARNGITIHTFPGGTIVTVKLNPLRDGRHFGVMTNTTQGLIACGSTMPQGGCTESTGKVYLGRQ
jgi:hypothetical protein